MSLFSKLFLGFGAFLVVASTIYALHAQEYDGLTLSFSVTGGALIIGWYGLSIVQRARGQLVAGPVKPGTAADDEAHVGPTIWPMVFALSMIGLVVGAVATPWAFVPGGILFIMAGVGWVVDVQRQWRHHHHADGESHEDSHEAVVSEAVESHAD